MPGFGILIDSLFSLKSPPPGSSGGVEDPGFDVPLRSAPSQSADSSSWQRTQPLEPVCTCGSEAMLTRAGSSMAWSTRKARMASARADASAATAPSASGWEVTRASRTARR